MWVAGLSRCQRRTPSFANNRSTFCHKNIPRCSSSSSSSSGSSGSGSSNGASSGGSSCGGSGGSCNSSSNSSNRNSKNRAGRLGSSNYEKSKSKFKNLTNHPHAGEDFRLPRWSQPGASELEFDEVARRHVQNDPAKILKRFESPVRQRLRLQAFGQGSSALKTITGEQAWRDYGLSASDLAGLPSMHRLGVVFDSSSVTRLFNKFEVQDAAIEKFGKVEGAYGVGSMGGMSISDDAVEEQRSASLEHEDADNIDYMLTAMKSHLEARKERGRRRRARVRQRAGPFQIGSYVALRRGPVRKHRSPDSSGPVPSSLPPGGRAVTYAVAGNTVILFAKLGAYAYSGSGAMLSEAMHSGADVMNQCLLFYGLQRSAKGGDEDHPYGYGFETYVWSMISAVGSFFLGAGASVYHGLSNLADALHSPTVISQLESTSGVGVMEQLPGSGGMMSQSELLVASAPVALGVLSVAGIIESYTALVAWSELQREAKAAGFSSTKAYILEGPDPVNVAVFLEDAIAVGGVGVAAIGISLTAITGNMAFDALGSIGVGLLMGGVSTFVIAKNRRLLGQSVPESTPAVVELLLNDEAVMSCQDVKAITLRPGVCRFKAEIQFNPTTLANKYLDQHPENLPGIKASFTRALHHSRTPPPFLSAEDELSTGTPVLSSISPMSSPSSAREMDGRIRRSDGGAGVIAIDNEFDPYVGTGAVQQGYSDMAVRQELHRYSRMLLLTLALEVDRLEQDIRKRHPEFRYIDLEVL